LFGKCCAKEISEVSDTVLSESKAERPKSEDSTGNVKSVIKDQQKKLKEFYDKSCRDERLKKLAVLLKKGSDDKSDSIEMKDIEKKDDIIDGEDIIDANKNEIETAAIVHENLQSAKIAEKNVITTQGASALLTPGKAENLPSTKITKKNVIADEQAQFDMKEIEILIEDLEFANQRADMAEKEAENLREQLGGYANYSCTPCGKSFTAIRSLQEHVKAVHGRKKTLVMIQIDEEFSP